MEPNGQIGILMFIIGSMLLLYALHLAAKSDI